MVTKLIFLFLVGHVLSASIRLDLGGSDQWMFRSGNGNSTGMATVPGDIYADLLNVGVLTEDPLKGQNDVALRWIGRTNWIYERKFTVDKPMYSKDTVLLVIRGLDTVGDVYINNYFVLSSTNQFHQHVINVRRYLQPGNNKIVINFESPVNNADVSAKLYELNNAHFVPPDCPPPNYNGECHWNFIRKVQSSFSWDWGPSFPTTGIWQPMFIQATDSAYVDRLSGAVVKQGDNFVVNVELYIYSAVTDSSEIHVYIPKLNIDKKILAKLKRDTMNKVVGAITIPASKVKLWWPNGYGQQNLYDVTAVAMFNGESLRSETIQIGFRTIELVQDFVDPSDVLKGRNFYFKINGVPIFLKGSNWIPVSSFPARNFTARMEFLLESARDIGMNALRVWGGGRFEAEEFYQMADRKGILLWHDLMFACALYPVDGAFLSNVKEEITTQITRIKHHPSILVWAGNNENELAIRQRWWIVGSYPVGQQIKDYIKLYKDTIQPLVKELDNSRPFLLSSPSNGVETEEEGGVAVDPANPRYGDVHYYNDISNLWTPSTYQIPRCATEYGVQSYPLKHTMMQYINESQWFYTSSDMLHRQHKPGGVLTVLKQVFDHFELPVGCNPSIFNDSSCLTGNFMSKFAYLSQFHQAIAYQVETEHYRRWRGRLDETGQGNTMCGLYWQLNDVWAAPTWSSIDFNLNWKPAHYFARRFFAPVIASMLVKNNVVQVFVVSDLQTDISNATVTLDALVWDNAFDPVYSTRTTVDIKALSSNPVHFDASNPEPKDFVLRARVFDSSKKQVGFDGILLPDHLKSNANFGKLTIGNFYQKTETEYKFTVTAEKVVPIVWIDVADSVKDRGVVATFSDNAFAMTTAQVTVTLKVRQNPKKLKLKSSDLTICHLGNCGMTDH
ncbi:hypothetical protein QR680_014081 [Steinernema hermaphroditum]|uniref:Beta-mannosidase n=1 Tax=Steinernema hermaphroditum TaxID=289476 RepID=A0AA39IAD2_9BILA|nr:hypothetical protein QR680_014081 [Steinernema hermaphroditum]